MILEALEREGVEYIFGYPGGANLPIYQHLPEHPRLKHILVRHEQGAAHMADGYARACGKPGVVFATSGPGALNLVTGLCTAYMDSVPMIAITGQVASTQVGRDAFQETDVIGATSSVTKHSYLVTSIDQLPRVIHEAFHIATTGRPGPVLIDICKDVQQANAERVTPDRLEIPGYQPNGHVNLEHAHEAARHPGRPRCAAQSRRARALQVRREGGRARRHDLARHRRVPGQSPPLTSHDRLHGHGLESQSGAERGRSDDGGNARRRPRHRATRRLRPQ